MASPPPEDVRRPTLPADLERLLHDLRGPLNSAVMHLEVVKRAGVDDPLAKQSLETIGQELVRLARMLPAAFSVAALDRNEMVVVDLRSTVEQELRRQGAASVRLLGSEWPRVRGDAELLTVAASHLIRNALEATEAAGPGRPTPTVTAESTDGLVTVERIARLHGGTLALSTPPDGGIEARLTLPGA